MARAIEKEELRKLYVDDDLTDLQIAEIVGVNKSYIGQLRRLYGIKTRSNNAATGRYGEMYVRDILLSRGHDVLDLNEYNKNYSYDLLVDGKIRIDVKTANLSYSRAYKWQFANSAENRVRVDELTGVTATGRTLKKYHKTCDFVALVAIEDDRHTTFIIPSDNELIKGIQTVSITNLINNRFSSFRNNWELIGGLENEQE